MVLWGSLTLSAVGVSLPGHVSLGFELHCPAPPHGASTPRTKLTSEPSDPQPLPAALLLMPPPFTRFPKQAVSLVPSLLLHHPFLSMIYCRNLVTDDPLPESPQMSLLHRGCVFSGHSKWHLRELTEPLGPNPLTCLTLSDVPLSYLPARDRDDFSPT